MAFDILLAVATDPAHGLCGTDFLHGSSHVSGGGLGAGRLQEAGDIMR